MEVEIWTFFTATPAGKDPENYLKRIEEDKRAVEIVGARYKHFDNQECFGRNYAKVTEHVRDDERELIDTIAEQSAKISIPTID